MIEALLAHIFPREDLPFGTRWRIFGSYVSRDTDTSRSFLKRGLPWFKGCGVYLHRIDKADDDRHLHNHPYKFGSLILTGGYAQDVQCADGAIRPRWVRPLEFHTLERSEYHRVKYLPNGHAWTVFFAGRDTYMTYGSERLHDWGFSVRGQHVPWPLYREIYGRE